jgi:hypothetical protein
LRKEFLSFHGIFSLLGDFPKLVHPTPSIKAAQGHEGFKHFPHVGLVSLGNQCITQELPTINKLTSYANHNSEQKSILSEKNPEFLPNLVFTVSDDGGGEQGVDQNSTHHKDNVTIRHTPRRKYLVHIQF